MIRIALLAGLLALAPVATGAQAQNSAHWTVAFTAPDAADIATARVLGESDLEQSAVTLTIHDAEGRLVYVDSWPFAWFHSNIPGPEGLYSLEQALRAMQPRVSGDVAELRPAKEILADPNAQGGAMWLETDPESYERARASDGNLVCYGTGHESGRCAWFDLERGFGVTLSGDGV